jgi:hypothetical protein
MAAGGAHIGGGGWAEEAGTSKSIRARPANNSASPWNGPEVVGITRTEKGSKEASVAASGLSEKGRTCYPDWVHIFRVSAR